MLRAINSSLLSDIGQLFSLSDLDLFDGYAALQNKIPDFCSVLFPLCTDVFLYFRMNKPYVSVVIAALNEEAAIGNVINDVPRRIADEIIVVDNGSTDRTAEVAAAAGARVVTEPQPGYGRAFRAGLRSLSADSEIVVFLAGDGSDYPEMMNRLR